MGLLGDIAKAVGLSSDSGANSNSASDTDPNSNPNPNPNSGSGSLSSIFSVPPTVIKANVGPPGPICDTACGITDAGQCVGCLERQAVTMSGIKELRTLERVLNINEDKPAVFAPAQAKPVIEAQAVTENQAQVQTQQQIPVKAEDKSAAGSWTCSCGMVNTMAFCPKCGVQNRKNPPAE